MLELVIVMVMVVIFSSVTQIDNNNYPSADTEELFNLIPRERRDLTDRDVRWRMANSFFPNAVLNFARVAALTWK